MSFDEKSLNFIYIFRNLFFFYIYFFAFRILLVMMVLAPFKWMNDEQNKAIISMCCRFSGVKFACSTKCMPLEFFQVFHFIHSHFLSSTFSSTGFSITINLIACTVHSAHLSWIKIVSHKTNFILISFQNPNEKRKKEKKTWEAISGCDGPLGSLGICTK